MQCPFGTTCAKSTSLVDVLCDLSGFPGQCKHPLTEWVNHEGTVIEAKHAPSKGRGVFVPNTPGQTLLTHGHNESYVSTVLEAYPPLLCRYLVTVLVIAIHRKPVLRYSNPVAAPQSSHPWDSRLGRERIEFSQSLRGIVVPDAKDVADKMAIGGLRNACELLDRLP